MEAETIRAIPELILDGDRRLIVAGDFRLAFAWIGDRWSHSLEFRKSDAAAHRILATSVEGDTSQDDPAKVKSPTYQDLQFQEIGSKLRALLIGQSGPHHFSAVFEFDIERFANGNIAQFVTIGVDVAVRCRSALGELSCSYTLDVACNESLFQSKGKHAPPPIGWEIGEDELSFCPENCKERPMDSCVVREGSRVRAIARLDPTEATHRLRYGWLWCEALRP